VRTLATCTSRSATGCDASGSTGWPR
jgi:hypothetical protein